MALRFLHTADWQLGKPFAGVVDDTKRHALQAERIAVLERIAEAARTHDAAFIVVAGDIFDSPTPTRSLVSQMCDAVGRMRRPVLMIPGNHDHGGPGSVWSQAFFKEESVALAPNLRVLLERRPVVMEQAVILPCGLLRRHENTDATSWVRGDWGLAPEAQALPRIVLAHGTVENFSAGGGDGDDDEVVGPVNHLDLARLPMAAIDYVALGDWHGMKQVGEKAWYSGTPEPDRFPKGESNSPGHVLLVEVARGSAPVVRDQPTARFGWHDLAFTFRDDSGAEQLAEQLTRFLQSRTQQDMLRLNLDGALGLEAMARLERLRETQESRLLRVKWESIVVVSPTEEETRALTARTQDPIVARVATQLVERAGSAVAADAALARTALRTLHLALQSQG